jgi:hypothetical protein
MIRTVKQWLAEKNKQKYERSKKLLFPGSLMVNPLTGEINLKFPQKDISEDYFIGTRGEPSEIPISFKLK